MTGAELIREQNYFLRKMENYAGKVPTSAQSLRQINHAVRSISRKIFLFDPLIVATFVADTRRYNLRNANVFNKPIVKPWFVIINGNTLLDASGRDFGMWSLSELQFENPSWMTSDSGVPYAAVYYGNNELILHGPPTSAVVLAGSNYVSGQYLAADLANTSATPSEIPTDLHECISYLAAVRAATPGIDEQAAWARVGAYNAEWKDLVTEQELENRSAIADWGSSSGQYTPRFIGM